MQGITFVLAVIDMSGSMGKLANDVRHGFNDFIDDLRHSEGAYRVTAVVFDDKYDPLCIAAPLDAVPRLTTTNYMPRGWTALFDAVGRTLADFEERAQVGEQDRVILFVQTDGEENFSKTYSAVRVRDMIRQRTATGQWDFKYIGSHADSWNQAERMGFLRGSTFASQATPGGTRAVYRGMTMSASAYAAGASPTQTSDFLTAAIAEDKDKDA